MALLKSNSSFQNKFKYFDYQLSDKVRIRLRQYLVHYDTQSNKQFEQNSIVKLLTAIFGQDREETIYVINHVFIYDHNNDGFVSYDQLINFVVEQHFGQLALQRLHRINLYSRGKWHIMNQKQFYSTLNECLQKINMKPNEEYVGKLFFCLDLNEDGWISYQDYLTFLREYLGSHSLNKITDVKDNSLNKIDKVRVKDNSLNKIDKLRDNLVNINSEQKQIGGNQQPEWRIGRLIYSQLKIIIMKYDINKNMYLTRQEVSQAIHQIFKISPQEQISFISKILPMTKITYQQFLRQFLKFYLCQYHLNKNYPKVSKIQQGSFPFIINKSLQFIPIKPSHNLIQTIFQKADQDKDGFITIQQYIQIIQHILSSYQFDTRGLTTHQSKQ